MKKTVFQTLTQTIQQHFKKNHLSVLKEEKFENHAHMCRFYNEEPPHILFSVAYQLSACDFRFKVRHNQMSDPVEIEYVQRYQTLIQEAIEGFCKQHKEYRLQFVLKPDVLIKDYTVPITN